MYPTFLSYRNGPRQANGDVGPTALEGSVGHDALAPAHLERRWGGAFSMIGFAAALARLVRQLLLLGNIEADA
jgi:hypothetical protein